MARYHVFLGAPQAHSPLPDQGRAHSWRAVSSFCSRPAANTLPPYTIAAVGRRISSLYQHVIFDDLTDEQDQFDWPLPVEDITAPQGEESTTITWLPTNPGLDADGGAEPRAIADLSFLHPSLSASRVRSQSHTQGTQDTTSYNFSDASSIANFPAFQFSLHSLTSLTALINHVQAARSRAVPKGSLKVNLLVAVLEIDGPDAIRIKRGPDAGKEVTLLKLILGDESGGICKLTAWRQVAEDWAGQNPNACSQSLKKGDIILLDNVLASWEYDSGGNAGAVPIICSASPQLRSRLQICYRTMPSTSQDACLRPDLRLGLSDAVVRKVATVVKWFESMVGLA